MAEEKKDKKNQKHEHHLEDPSFDISKIDESLNQIMKEEGALEEGEIMTNNPSALEKQKKGGTMDEDESDEQEDDFEEE